MECNTIGERIAYLRKVRGISQGDLAKAMFVKREVVTHWEIGDRDLKTEYTIKLADYFGVSCDYLLRGIHSEDIDIAIDREYLGFSGILSRTQISDKLRRATCSFVRETMQYDLAEQLYKNGIAKDKYQVNVDITSISTTDPETININYDSVLTFSVEGENGLYILPKVKVEVSGRSMSEPVSEVPIESMIDNIYPNAPFAESKFNVRTVLPERTFLEKIFLLHEEFAKDKELIKIERMSRHMYDIGQMLKTPIAESAIRNEQLYRQVVEHRRTFIGLRGFDYDSLYPNTLNFIPPPSIIEQWKADYENMLTHMIYGETVSFEKLVNNLYELNKCINNIS